MATISPFYKLLIIFQFLKNAPSPSYITITELGTKDIKMKDTVLILKDGKDQGQEKGTTEDEMVGWHH